MDRSPKKHSKKVKAKKDKMLFLQKSIDKGEYQIKASQIADKMLQIAFKK